MDSEATLAELKDLVRRFCDAREWDPFHGPKDVAIGLITEASELLEHFRFLTEGQQEEVLADTTRRLEVEDELADVFFFVLRFAGRFGIDLDNAFRRKMRQNDAKYPVEKSRGRNTKYDRLG